MDRQASELGYRWQAVARQVKNGQDHWSGLWLSADGRTVLMVLGGRPHKKATQRSILATRMSDGRYIETTDVPALRDLTGMYDVGFLLRADLFELQRFHETRLAAAAAEAIPLEPGKVIRACAAAASRRVFRLPK